MENIKDQIFNLKKELEAKEQQYAQQQQAQIHNLEKEIEQLKNNSENKIEQLELKRNELDEEIKHLKKESQKKKDETDNILQKVKASVNEFITSRNKISEKNDEIQKLTLQNRNILNQQINISNLTFIQELSLLQLDIKIQEYKEKEISEKEFYRGLFDVSYRLKIAVDLNDLGYELSEDKKTLSIYNMNIITSLAKTHKTHKIFSEMRKKQEKNLLGFGDNGWMVSDEQSEVLSKYDKEVESEIGEKIDNNTYIENNISIIEDSFNKAIEQYLINITGNNFEIQIYKTKKEKALTFKNCFEAYNIDLNKQIKPIANIQKAEDIERILLSNIHNLDNKK